MRSRSLFWSVLLVFGCAGGQGDSLEDGPPEPPLRAGLWSSVDLGVSGGICGTLADGWTGSEWRLDWVDDDRYEIGPLVEDDSLLGETTLCVVDGNEVFCDYNNEPSLQPFDENTTLSFLALPDGPGEILSTEQMNEPFRVEVGCEGESCDDIEAGFQATFPCVVSMEIRNEWVGPIASE